MLIQSRTIFGLAAAFTLVGGALWGSALLIEAPAKNAPAGTVEVVQMQEHERAWAVEVKELGSETTARTAANR